MAYRIGAKCFSCYGCETVCLADAISVEHNRFIIDPSKCTECKDLPQARCIAICPEAGAIFRAEDKQTTKQDEL